MTRAPELAFGALFLLATAGQALAAPPGSALSLASQLFEEGNWRDCRTECRRILVHTPQQEQARLLNALCRVRLTGSTAGLLDLLQDGGVSPGTTHLAHYEIARSCWKAGNRADAFAHFKTVFESASDTELFMRAGCSLALIIREQPGLIEAHPALENQLESAACLWPRQLWDDCRIQAGTQRQSWTGRPPQWVIAFYRSQVRPAIGSRCSLHPSCSEYAMRALGRFGLLGIPLYGDRAVREPDVIKEKRAPIWINRRRLYRDPLSEHICWWHSPDKSSRENAR